jgi:hypothetical protein
VKARKIETAIRPEIKLSILGSQINNRYSLK